MELFLKKIIIFVALFVFLLLSTFYLNEGSFDVRLKNSDEINMHHKVKYFSKFLSQNDTINLILGSSTTKYAIIPDSISSRWFSFANASQNIYESFKFLDFYKDSVVIDTIIIGVEPFDFPYSYIKKRRGDTPSLNGNFKMFGKDSITSIKKNLLLTNVAAIKKKFFYNFKDLTQNSNNRKKTKLNPEILTDQGYSIRRDKVPINLDSLYKIAPLSFDNHLQYFVNIQSIPNLKYFELFDSLATSLDIKVLYLMTPKSKFYHKSVKIKNYDKIWLSIKDSLNKKQIEIWNYENINVDTLSYHLFWDETHLVYDGARFFTKIIKQRLKE